MRVVLALAIALYPVLVYVGLTRWQPRTVALALALVLILRALIARTLGPRTPTDASAPRFRVPVIGRGGLARILVPVLLVGGVIGAAVLWNNQTMLLFVPAGISAVLLLSFGATLVRPPTIIELFARMWVRELSPAELQHCRRTTWVWCGFFVANGGLAAWLAAHGRTFAWTLYNGLVAYVLIGVLIVGEMAYRAWRFRRYVGEPLDPLLIRLFPPPATQTAEAAPEGASA